jgi:GT2 family glycosyltransferase
VRYIEELIYSCVLQSWPHWELIIVDNGSTKRDHIAVIEEWQRRDSRIKLIQEEKNLGISGGRNRAIEHASGDLVCILDHDDIIHPQILGTYGRMCAADPRLSLIYSNEVKLADDSSAITDFYSKPEFSLAGLERTNFICHFVAMKRELMDKVRLPNGEWFQPHLDGVEDHDFYLRLCRVPEAKLEHLPVFAYFWRVCPGSTASTVGEKPYVYGRAETMLNAHLTAMGKEGAAQIDVVPTTRFPRQLYSIHYQASQAARATILIPFRDHFSLTKKLLDSLLIQDGIQRHQVILINNRSSDPETAKGLSAYLAAKASAFGKISVIDFDEPFNYGKMHNVAIRQAAENPYLLLINNDIELLDPATLQTMLGELETHEKTGFVGIRLSRPNKAGVQHGGIKVDASPVELGLFHLSHILDRNGDLPFDERSVFANSFACVATRKSLFLELGGLEESFFPNGCGDVEMAIRGRRLGYESFYLGTIEAVHHESATRETSDESVEEVLLSRMYASDLAKAQAHRFSHCEGLDLLGRGAGGIFKLPLRYRVADAVNDRVKKALGPVHRLVKKSIKSV